MDTGYIVLAFCLGYAVYLYYKRFAPLGVPTPAKYKPTPLTPSKAPLKPSILGPNSRGWHGLRPPRTCLSLGFPWGAGPNQINYCTDWKYKWTNVDADPATCWNVGGTSTTFTDGNGHVGCLTIMGPRYLVTNTFF